MKNLITMVMAILLMGIALHAQSQHITMLQAQGEISVECNGGEITWENPVQYLTRQYADLSLADEGRLTVNSANISGVATLLLYYRGLGDSTWAYSGISVTTSTTGHVIGSQKALPAPMSAEVELALWTSDVSGAAFAPLSVSFIASQ